MSEQERQITTVDTDQCRQLQGVKHEALLHNYLV
jgi:hypothetical protein